MKILLFLEKNMKMHAHVLKKNNSTLLEIHVVNYFHHNII